MATDPVLALRAELERQKALNAELHKGVCAGYSRILAWARQMEGAIKHALDSGFACEESVEARLRASMDPPREAPP